MSRIDPQQGLMPSLLDRLIDPEADGTNWQRGYSVQQMVAAVFRDLEELLNTHQTAVRRSARVRRSAQLHRRLRHARSHLDPGHHRGAAGADRPTPRNADPAPSSRVCATSAPRCSTLDSSSSATVKFRIEARCAWTRPRRSAFDTILELTTGRSTISRTDALT